MMNADYGTYKFGRLTYRTANEAEGAARDLGISGVHSHQMKGQTVFMPGEDHETLNAALEANGLRPMQHPRKKSGGMMGGLGLGMGSDDGGGLL